MILMKRTIVGLVAGLTVAFAAAASAQTVANGPYYATPSWDQTMPASTRFIVLSNMKSEAVLDRETGLVWQRTPLSGYNDNRGVALNNCLKAAIGGRQGWRLPRVDELMSLADPENTAMGQDHLPAGHPFSLTPLATYWASDHIPANLADGGIVVFFDGSAGAGLNHINDFDRTGARAWCVRGGAAAAVR